MKTRLTFGHIIARPVGFPETVQVVIRDVEDQRPDDDIPEPALREWAAIVSGLKISSQDQGDFENCLRQGNDAELGFYPIVINSK